jgi:uncharacterized membrane protein HdeD (DUF308 family)
LASLTLTYPGRGWSFASWLIAVALGVMLAMRWRESSAWFLGFAVGVDLILDGCASLMFAAAPKKLLPS